MFSTIRKLSFQFLSYVYIVICKCFQFKIESIFRQQNVCDSEVEICFSKGRKNSGKYSFRGLMIVTATRIHFSLTAVHCFDNRYVRKQPVAWKEYCVNYWLKELLESMDRCTGRCDITVENGIKTNQSINLTSPYL